MYNYAHQAIITNDQNSCQISKIVLGLRLIYTYICRLISEIRFIVIEATRKIIRLYTPVPYFVEMGGKFKGAAYCDIA